MLKEIQEIVSRTTGKTDITIDTDFIKDLKLNSFDIVSIVTFFEERYNCSIPTRDLRKIHTVRDFIEYANSKGIT